MVPFTNFVLKMHSNCNLRCKYCYVYESPDKSWMDKPAIVSQQVMEYTARCIAEHVRRHQLTEITVIFHGGEPFMAGADRMVQYLQLIRDAVGPTCQVYATVQTNGTMLTEANIRKMEEARISIGVSLDGGTEEFNALRVTREGHKPSFKLVERGLKRLGTRPALEDGFRAFAGLLCTVYINSDPKKLYNSYQQLAKRLGIRIPQLNFLLPHANYEAPPLQPKPVWSQKIVQQFSLLSAFDAAREPRRLTPYGDWLIKMFDCWAQDPEGPAIPLFEAMIDVNQMRGSTSDEVGLSAFGAIVVETDGAVELDDDLRSTYAGATSTGLNVVTSSFDEALLHEGVRNRQAGVDGVPTGCANCIFNSKCGGGNYAHRYKKGTARNGFDNPSVYCEDLKVILAHVAHESERVVRIQQRAHK